MLEVLYDTSNGYIYGGWMSKILSFFKKEIRELIPTKTLFVKLALTGSSKYSSAAKSNRDSGSARSAEPDPYGSTISSIGHLTLIRPHFYYTTFFIPQITKLHKPAYSIPHSRLISAIFSSIFLL